MRRRGGDRGLLGLIVAVVVLAACMGAATATDIVHFVTGKHGIVTVTGCTTSYGAKGKVTYHCGGTYAADDGSTTLTGVTFDDSYGGSPGEREPATLDGSTADDVHLVRYANLDTGIVVFTGCVVALVLLLVFRARRAARPDPTPR
jgi:ABC-type sulfate transport system substrate-binding protein